MCIQAHVIVSKLPTAPIYGSTQPRFTLFSHQGEAPGSCTGQLFSGWPLLCTHHFAGTLWPHAWMSLGVLKSHLGPLSSSLTSLCCAFSFRAVLEGTRQRLRATLLKHSPRTGLEPRHASDKVSQSVNSPVVTLLPRLL